MRQLKGAPAWIMGIFSIAFIVWSIYGAIYPIETYIFRMVHMGFIFALSFPLYPFIKKQRIWVTGLDIFLAMLGVATIVYALIDVDGFIRRSTLPEPLDFYMGIAAIVLLIEVSRRIVGTTFTLVLVGSLLYCWLGNYIPGPITHRGYELDRIIGHMYMTLEGIFGVPLSVSVSFVTLFVVYGTFMDAAGAGNFWLELSLAVMGRGPASAGRGAVITTALLGGPQGSGVATTMSVSPVMWPILKKAGYSPNMAAGLIAAGGIGAVLSPPLMGAAAFLIMQFLNVSFWDVVIMVIFPTVLYYLGTFFLVELEAKKYNFQPPESSGLTTGQVMKRYWYHLISLAVLIALLVAGRSPQSAAIWAIVATIATSFLSKDRNEWLTPKNIIKATIEGAQNMIPVAALLAAAGIIVGMFSLTGLGLKISGLIMSWSGGIPVAALFLALLASMIIGLSLPITATYIMTVVMVAPALVKVGVPMHVAHLLAFYFAVLSEVSPPVGLSPSAAAAVTGGNPFGAMMQAWKYSVPAFLVPFQFSSTLLGANLLIIGATIQGFILALFTSSVSLFYLSLGIIGYLKDNISIIERGLLIASAVIMAFVPLNLSPQGIIPLLVGAAIVILHSIKKKG
ncbi:MAG TPA: TRAP transporter fused permease subunit [Syntrophorhabdaceae bacterium]|nr:TRAP transporter fused permease subunit [Syntrophorhabdaceae bacterium]HPC67367.1 TRAP transporter fused permease subunit [Syntrophorhabdaceae bacterium]HQE80398.1 TRAP transporter fused permease subunit [Syntrophorhabdaceae bacterium]HQH43760.1 TRAP transporter fused permease subunit [Syntrophorhabdaceae bacterium]HQK46432.1 TRAP transporter fused permease subunit [Syntrophorhabdaceae bacterium]